MKKVFLSLVLLSALSFTFVSCREEADKAKGSMEKVGEDLDELGDDIEEGAEKAADDVKDAANEAADEVEDAADEAGDEMEDAVDDN